MVMRPDAYLIVGARQRPLEELAEIAECGTAADDESERAARRHARGLAGAAP
jgi:hypothetical protein